MYVKVTEFGEKFSKSEAKFEEFCKSRQTFGDLKIKVTTNGNVFEKIVFLGIFTIFLSKFFNFGYVELNLHAVYHTLCHA